MQKTAEAEYSMNFSILLAKFCLNLHYNGSSIFFYLLKQQLYSSSKYSTSNNMIKTGLNKYVHDFSIDYNIN